MLCFDELTGRLIWEHSYPTDYANIEYGNGLRATPTGQLIWKRDSVKDFKGIGLQYGYSEAPLVIDDVVIVYPDGKPDACVVTWSHPAYANKHVFAHSDREWVCTWSTTTEGTPSCPTRGEFPGCVESNPKSPTSP